jgi:hypothetical protein
MASSSSCDAPLVQDAALAEAEEFLQSCAAAHDNAIAGLGGVGPRVRALQCARDSAEAALSEARSHADAAEGALADAHARHAASIKVRVSELTVVSGTRAPRCIARPVLRVATA